MRTRWLSLAGMGLYVVMMLGSGASRARACSGPPCTTDQFLPVSGVVPRNAPAFAVYLGGDSRGGTYTRTAEQDITFSCRDESGVSAPVPFELRVSPADCGEPRCSGVLSLVVPMVELTAARTCYIAGTDCDGQWAGHSPLAGSEYLQGHAELVLAEAADLPTTLGTLALSEPRWEVIELGGGSGCSFEETVCAVRVELTPSEDAVPWQDALIYETWVDGERYYSPTQMLGTPEQHGGSYLGRRRELLFYRPIEPARPRALMRGMHSVVMRATVPGSDTVVESTAQQLSLDCGDPFPDDAGASTSPEADAGESTAGAGSTAGEPNAGQPSAPVGGEGAARPEEQPADAGAANGLATEESTSRGCAVARGNGRATAKSGVLAMLLAGLTFLRLGRRRRLLRA